MAEETQLNKEAAEEQKPEENNAAAEAAETVIAETAKVEEPKPEVKKVKNSILEIEKSLLAENNNAAKYPVFTAGDTVKVYVKIIEGDKQRIQPYEGVVIAIRHGGARKSFIVRRISYGVAIERVFPFYSTFIQKIELVRKGRVRRAKLYYLRGRFGKSAVITEKV